MADHRRNELGEDLPGNQPKSGEAQNQQLHQDERQRSAKGDHPDELAEDQAAHQDRGQSVAKAESSR